MTEQPFHMMTERPRFRNASSVVSGSFVRFLTVLFLVGSLGSAKESKDAHNTTTLPYLGECSDTFEDDADLENVYEVNLLQTHIALGHPKDLQMQAQKPYIEPAPPVITEVATNSSAQSASSLQDDYANLMQTELELLPSVNASSPIVGASSKKTEIMLQIEATRTNHSEAWMFVSCACILTLFALWYEVEVPRTGESSAENQKPGSKGTVHYRRTLNPIVTEIPVQARDDRWDFIRLVIIWALIGSHLAGSFRAEAGLQIGNAFPDFAAFSFSAFVFVSGMFSSSTGAKEVMMTLVGFPVTLFLLAGLTWFVSIMTPERQDTFEIGRSMAEWYLECMFCWRLTVSTIFYAFENCRAPKVMPLLLVIAASWILASRKFQLDDVPQVYFAGMVKIRFPWHMLICNAPFFAAGLMLTPKRWSELMDKRCLTAAAYVSLVVFAFVAFWPETHRVVPWRDYEALHTIVMLCMAFQSTFVIGSWLAPLRILAPTVVEHLVCCSRRSCQAFNFHWPLFILAGGRLGCSFFAEKLVLLGTSRQALIVVLMSLWLTLVLSSRFAERICGWLLNLPIQLVDLLSKYFETNSKASQKAFDMFEPIYLPSASFQKKIVFSSSGLLLHSEPTASGP